MNIVAIIPARGGSKGIPNKNINILNGLPLISWTIFSALKSKLINRVIVSTDSEKIREIAIANGAEVPYLRPCNLATDDSTTESVIIDMLEYLEKERYKTDIVVLLQPTSPKRDEGTIDKSIEFFMENNADSLFTAVRCEQFIWECKSEISPQAFYDFCKRPRRQDNIKNHFFLENGSIYITKKDLYINENNRLGGKIVMYEMSGLELTEIDTQDDWELMEILLRENKNEKN